MVGTFVKSIFVTNENIAIQKTKDYLPIVYIFFFLSKWLFLRSQRLINGAILDILQFIVELTEIKLIEIGKWKLRKKMLQVKIPIYSNN